MNKLRTAVPPPLAKFNHLALCKDTVCRLKLMRKSDTGVGM